jgi:malonyl-CoA/methylmalonyl-CoA synthetase
VVGALVAGVPIVPLNPKLGERELEHVLGDSDPALVLATPGEASAPATASATAPAAPCNSCHVSSCAPTRRATASW